MDAAMSARREGRARAVLRSLPCRFRSSITITAAVVVIGILTGTVFRSNHHSIIGVVGLDLQALKAGRVWFIPVATLIPAQPGIKWHLALFVLVAVGLLEYVAGSLRAVVTFFLSDWLGSPLTILALWGLATAGSSTAERLVHNPDTGPSAAAFGASVAAAIVLSPPLRWVALIGLSAFLSSAFAFQQLDVALAHAIAAAVGAGLTVLWRLWARSKTGSKQRATRSESEFPR